jgi:hypothetical protein
MLQFPRYSPQGVDPCIQTIRAVWPVKPKDGYVKRSDATSPLAAETPRYGVDAVISSKQRGGWAPSNASVPEPSVGRPEAKLSR